MIKDFTSRKWGIFYSKCEVFAKYNRLLYFGDYIDVRVRINNVNCWHQWDRFEAVIEQVTKAKIKTFFLDAV